MSCERCGFGGNGHRIWCVTLTEFQRYSINLQNADVQNYSLELTTKEFINVLHSRTAQYPDEAILNEAIIEKLIELEAIKEAAKDVIETEFLNENNFCQISAMRDLRNLIHQEYQESI